MKAPEILSLPKAPVGGAVRRASAMFPGPGLFAHHPPMPKEMLEPGNARMERPHGGKGPHTPNER